MEKETGKVVAAVWWQRFFTHSSQFFAPPCTYVKEEVG